MFPINFNFPYRKKDGSVITMEKALDGAGADLDLIDLDDVAVQTPTDNEGLVYNGSTQKLKNEPVVTGDLWVENAAHNVLPYPYKDGTNTYSNVEITVNSDGSISGTGTSNDSNALRLLSGKMRKGAYKLRFNGTITNCYLSVYDTTSSTTLAETTSGDTDISFTIDATNADHQIQIHILFGADKAVTINGKPLLRMASDPSTANAPYAMTNGELTEMFRPALKNSGLTPTYCSITDGGYYEIGNLVIVQMRISNSSDVQNRLIAGLPSYSGYYNHVTLTGFDYVTSANVPVTIDTDGVMTVMDTSQNGVIIAGCYIKK